MSGPQPFLCLEFFSSFHSHFSAITVLYISVLTALLYFLSMLSRARLFFFLVFLVSAVGQIISFNMPGFTILLMLQTK